jgi:hypothetical protein
MNDVLLAYTLREAERGIRMMARDRSILHVFDLGKTPDGEEWCFVMSVVPKSTVAVLERYDINGVFAHVRVPNRRRPVLKPSAPFPEG